jgi:hypothetical protein
LEFLNPSEHKAVLKNNTFKVSLYKAILFQHVSEGIKSGQLIFEHTYKHKGIFDYLIDETVWSKNRKQLLEAAGLKEFDDINTVLKKLRQQLSQKYIDVNKRIVADENPYIGLNVKGKVVVKTPKIDNDDFAFVGKTLMQDGFIPIQTILSDVNDVCHFSDCFSHYANKNKKMCPNNELLLAGILGKGCNLGLRRIANISNGISEDVLKNTVNWFFDPKNIRSASRSIIEYIDRLALANAYKYDPDSLHTSSDGQKYYVAVDSLNSAYSFKYFGKDKGSTVYTFS